MNHKLSGEIIQISVGLCPKMNSKLKMTIKLKNQEKVNNQPMYY